VRIKQPTTQLPWIARVRARFQAKNGVVHDHNPVIEVCMIKSLTGFSDWPRRPDLGHLEDDEAAMAARARMNRSHWVVS
jgi:hypothetical protein